MFIIIENVIYYGRHYSEEHVGSYWWFNLNDYKIYSIKQLESLFDGENCFTQESILEKEFIPFSKTEIIEVEKDYIKKKNNKKLSKVFSAVSEVDFDQVFKKYIDNNLLISDWWNFEREKLISDAVEWCKLNGIKYRFKQL